MTTFRITVLTIVFIIMIALTGMNLTFSNTIWETCGVIHPYIFQTQVSIIDPATGRDWSSVSGIPSSPDEQLDTYLRIYDENGHLLEQNDDYQGTSAGIIDFKVSTPRTIIVEVATFDDASQGHYELEVKDTPEDLSEVYPEITVGSTVSGEIKSNSRNSYLLSLIANEPVSIMINGTDIGGLEMDTHLRIYNESNQMINQNDDFGNSYGSGIAPFSVSEDSTVIIEVATFNDASEGRYNLVVEPYVPEQVEDEQGTDSDVPDIFSNPDIDIFEGDIIDINDSVSDFLEFDSRVQHTLNLSANQFVDIYLESELDTYLRIYDEFGDLLAENDDFNELNAGFAAFGLPEDASINIVVASYDDFDEGDYQLIVEESPLQINQTDSISLNDSLQADIEAGTRNRHSLNLEADQLVNIYLEGNLDTYVRLYDSSGRLLQENDDLNDFNAGISNFSTETAETFTIEVSTFGDSEAGQYQLSVEESNLQLIDGSTMVIDNPVSGDMLPDTRTRYRLDMVAGQVISVSMTGENADGTVLHSYLRIYDEAGQLLIASENFEEMDAVIPRFDAFDDMSLIIEAASYSDNEAGTYQITIEEFQTEIVSGDAIQVGSSISNAIEEGQRVQHALELNPAQIVTILLDGGLDTYLRIYDEEGNLLAESDDLVEANAGIVDFSVETPSTVIVEVATFIDAETGDYELIVEPYSLEFVQQLFDLEITSASEITPDNAIRGEINPGQRIHHNLSLRKGQIVNIFLNGEHIDGYLLDTHLRIYDESGNILAENDDLDGPNSGIFDFSVQESMTVTIEVSTFADSEIGVYELFVEANNTQVNTLDEIAIGNAVTGSIKPEQRIRYTLNLEADRSISIFLRRDESQSGLSLGELSNFLRGSANEWVSCLEYYGYVVESAYFINQDGLGEFVYGSKLDGLCDLQNSECEWSANITLTAFGQFLFYVILPGLAIILPIITVFMLKGDWEALWFVSLILVALYVLTSALLYVHLGTVSGIVALSEFAYGMFGGTATGAAIAFMTKVLDNFSIDRSTDTSEQAKSILEIIEAQLRYAAEERNNEAQNGDNEPDVE